MSTPIQLPEPPPPKPRGVRRHRTSKNEILTLLHTSGSHMKVADIAKAMTLSPKCVRQHLYELEKSLEVQCAWFTTGGRAFAAWAARGAPKPVEAKKTPPPPKTQPAEISDESLALVQTHVPAGAWRLDHAIPARSVFELVEAA